MTPHEYLEENECKKLSKKELSKGKDNIKIRGTKDLMPWTEVYTRISAGMSMEHIAEIYGNGRKIALWAIRDGIEFNPTLSDAVDGEITQRRKMHEVAVHNPDVARTMLEMANEYAPDVGKRVVMLSQSLVEKAQKLVNAEDCTSNDLQNIAKAVQTMTDTIELTQRHGSAIKISGGGVQVEGFSFVLDVPPEADVIDVTTEEVDDETD
mgnify:CR=1 FL=1